MQQSIIYIFLSSAVICLLLAVGFLTSKKLQVLPARLMGINYLLCATLNFLAFLLFGLGWEFAGQLRGTIAMTLGPAMYFYYCSLVGNERAAVNLSFLHLFPAILVMGLWAAHSRFLWIVEYLIIISFAFYLIFTFKLLMGSKQRLQHLAQHADAAYRWLIILATIMTINLIVEISVCLELLSGVPLGQSVALCVGTSVFLLFNAATLLLVITRAPLTEWMHALQDLRLSKSKPISDAEARDIFDRWERVVSERELYKREGGVTLEQAGRILVIPARQISQAINRKYGGSFSQYLNDCRVKAAQTLLRDNADMPITTLMMEAGFSTKSNFNKEFLRVTGLSPSDYRKQAEATSPAQ
jgi:AraC-like DNA-binding protein